MAGAALAGPTTQPRLDYAPYRSRASCATRQGPAARRPGGLTELWSPGLRPAPTSTRSSGPHHPATRGAARRAHHRRRSRARRRRPAGAPPAGGDLAGQRGRPVRAPARPAPGAARPELHRRRPLPDRRRRHVLVHHDQARAPTRGRTTSTPGGPAHIHFSLFGTDFTQRMVTQMYFPGDPLFAFDPIYQSITDARARERAYRRLRPRPLAHGLPLGYRWDIVLTGSHAHLIEPEDH